MGMILKDVGKFTVEVRRESFIVHYEDGDPRDVAPEYLIEDMDNLQEALVLARAYVDNRS